MNTVEHLSALHTTMQKEGVPQKPPIELEDDNVPYGSQSDSDFEDSDCERYKKSSKSKQQKSRQLQGIDMIYVDNQKLWSRYSKALRELERIEERLRYLQLEYNNKCVENERLSSENSKHSFSIKSITAKITKLECTHKWTLRLQYILELYFALTSMYLYFNVYMP